MKDARGDGEEVSYNRRIVDSRSVRVPRPPAEAFRPILRIGGDNGWYYANWLWWLRGFFDLMLGGVGVHRGRPSRGSLSVGDTIDCWRVVAIEPDRLLRLCAEMKLPGNAWLQFEVDGEESHSTIRQTAIFEPRGILGLVYWYGLYPAHKLVFAGMLRGIAKAVR
ncbi:MAG TPA: DUF2867 domain-containing protein [Candidatus Acidoferrales bacterium]|nr:DUF2867 domain-containing protein [Candidatus Acidoferrales bacterium]